jgi:hypothetical protein
VSDDISIPAPTYRVPRRRGLSPETRRLAIIAGALGTGFVTVVGGWTLLGGGHHGVPVVQAEAGPVRVKPANPGGLQVAGAGNEIFSGGSDTNVGKLAPAPEAPDPQALMAPPAPKPQAPAAAAATPSTAAPADAAPAKPAPAQPKPAVVTGAAVKQAIATTAAPVKPAGNDAAQEKREAAPAARVGGKVTLVQLAALSSEEAAKTEWQLLSKRMPELFSGRQPTISKVERAGHTFWRVRTGGFSDTAQATAFCERVRSKGNGCSLADF